MTRKMTNQELTKHFGNLEDHVYNHYNRSLGCFVHGKEHFKQLLAAGNFIPYDLAKDYAESYDKREQKRPELSNKAREIINSVKLTADKHGNIKLGGRAIAALKEIGAIPSQSVQDQIMKIYKEDNALKGGFGKNQ